MEGIQHLKKAAGPCHQLVYRYCPNNQGTFRRYPPDARDRCCQCRNRKSHLYPSRGRNHHSGQTEKPGRFHSHPERYRSFDQAGFNPLPIRSNSPILRRQRAGRANHQHPFSWPEWTAGYPGALSQQSNY